MSGLDLSQLTLALNGAEPVDPDAVEAFVAAAEPFGFTPGGVFPAFGMAEVAIGGTFPPRRPRAWSCDSVDRVVLERDRVAKPLDVADADEELDVRRLPLLGKAGARPGDAHRRSRRPATSCPSATSASSMIRGTSVTPGYYKRPDATAALFHDGWLRTGDLAYLVDGELVLCGRIKDVIIVGGRNVFPEDIERAVRHARRRARRQRDRVRRRGLQGQGERRRRRRGAQPTIRRRSAKRSTVARSRSAGCRLATSCSSSRARCRRRRPASCSAPSAASCYLDEALELV